MVNHDRKWQYQGLSTIYTDRNGQIVTTSRIVDNNPRTVETTTYPDQSTFTSKVYLNSDGSPRQGVQTVTGSTHSASTVSLAYDAFGRQIRDSQEITIGGDPAPAVGMEYAWHDSGSLKKIARKLNEDRVTETTFQVDGLGNIVSILDDVRSDGSSHWINADLGTDKYVTFDYAADGSIKHVTRYAGSSDATPQRGYSVYNHRTDGRPGSVANHESVSPGAVGPTITSHKLIFNDDGTLHRRFNTVESPSAETSEPFIKEFYQYNYGNDGKLTEVVYDDLNDTFTSPPRPVDHDSSGNDIHNTDAGRGNRVYVEQLDNGTRKYVYDLEGRIVQRDDSITYSDSGYTYFITEKVDHTWDHRGRLTEVERYYTKSRQATADGPFEIVEETTGIVHYFYDAFDRRIGRTETIKDGNGFITFSTASAIAHDATGKAFELLLDGNLNQIHRNYLNSPAGVLAVDQTAHPAINGADPTLTGWLFGDVSGTVATTAFVDQNGDWQRLLRRFTDEGGIADEGGATSIGQLSQIPAIWRGQQFDEVSHLYLNASSGILPDTGIASYQSSGDVTAWHFLPSETAKLLKGAYQDYVPEPIRYFGRDYVHYLNPQNSLDEGGAWNTTVAYAQTGGWVAAGTATGGLIAGGGAVVTAGAVAGSASGLFSTYASDPNASLGAYAFSGSFGGLIGGVNAPGSFASLGGGGIGAAIGGSKGYLVGDLAGGILGGAGKDLLKSGFKHAARYAAVEGSVATAGAGIGYAATGTVDGALFGANVGSMAGGAAAARYVKCFVGDTPVYVPIDPENRLAASGATEVAFGSGWRMSVAVVAALGMSTFVASEAYAASKRREQDETTAFQHHRARHVDLALGDDDRWLDPVETLWSESPLAEPAADGGSQAMRSAADQIAEEFASHFKPAKPCPVS